MYRSIVLPLDGSSFSEEAVPLAGLLAERFGARLHLIHVIRPVPDLDFKSPEEDMNWKARLREAASDALGETVAELRADGVDAAAEVREGRVVDTLLETIEERAAGLVVLTSHGTGGFRRWWLGSVADSLIRRSHTPVLLVRPWDDTEDEPSDLGTRFHTILVPLDGSPASEDSLEHARAVRDRMGGRMILVRVVPSVHLEGPSHREHRQAAEDYLDEVVDRELLRDLEEPDEIECRVVEASEAAEGILETARVTGAELIVLASMGRGGFSRTVLGSVADKVIRGAATPVLVIPPEESEETAEGI